MVFILKSFDRSSDYSLKNFMTTHNQLPFSTFTNNGLGLVNASLTRTGLEHSAKTLGQATIQIAVNAANGNLVVRDHLKTIDAPGFKIPLSYIYNSLSQPGWRFCGTKGIDLSSVTATNATVVCEDGHLLSFIFNADKNCYIATDDVNGDIYLNKNSDNSWTWQQKGIGHTIAFNAAGLQTAVADRQGRSVNYQYDDNDNLQTITAGMQTIHFERTDTDLKLKYSEDDLDPIVLQSYHFNAKGNLETTTIPLDDKNNYSVNYTYNDQGLLSGIAQSDKTSCKIEYDAQKRFAVFTDGINNTFQAVYQAGYTQLKTMTGVFANLYFDASQKLTRFMQPSGKDVSYAYANNRLQTKTLTNKGVIQYSYDDYGCVNSTLDAENTYFQKVIRDDNGNIICRYLESVADQQIILQECRIIDEFQNCRYSIDGEGHVIAYTFDDKHNLQTEREFPSRTLDMTGLTPSNLPTDDQLSAFVLAKDQADTRLKVYASNSRGQSTGLTDFALVNPDGSGADNPDNYNLSSQKNIFGHVEKTTKTICADKLAQTTLQYDGLQRQILHIDAENNQTATIHDDINACEKTTQANGRVDTISHNGAGEIVNSSQTWQDETRSITTSFDAKRNVVITTLASGQKSYAFYNDQNQLIIEVNANSYVKCHTFNDHDQPLSTIEYADEQTQLDFSTVTADELIKTLKPNTQTDRLTTIFYDKNHRLRYQINAEGEVSEYQYAFGCNKPAAIIHYGTRLIAERKLDVDGRLSGLQTDSGKDRLVYRFYDKCQRLIGEQQSVELSADTPAKVLGRFLGFGYKTRQQICVSRRYDMLTEMSQDIAIAQPANSGDDIIEYSIRDRRERLIGEIDAENFYTAHDYTACGLVQKTSRYLPTVDTSADIDEHLRPDEMGYIEWQSHDYDMLERINSLQKSGGYYKTHEFDNMGHEIHTVQGDIATQGDMNQDRHARTMFNGFGDCTAELLPRVAKQFEAINKDDKLTPEEKKAELDALWQTKSHTHAVDNNGLCIATTDLRGNTTHYFYDNDKNLVITINAKGAIQETIPTAFKKEVSATRHYDQLFDVAELQNLTGGFLSAELRATIDKLKHANDCIELRENDRVGRLIKLIDADKYVHVTEYNAFGDTEKTIEPISDTQQRITIKKHNLAGKVIEKIINPDSPILRKLFNYFTWRGSKTITDVISDTNSDVTELERDKLGRETKRTFASKVYQTFYDAFRVYKEISPLGRIKNHDYNQILRRLTITPGDCQVRRVETIYNVFKQLVQKNNANGALEQNQYGVDGKIEVHTNAAGANETHDYNEQSNPVSIVGYDNVKSSIQLDAANHPQSITVDPDNTKLKTCYERNSQNTIIGKTKPNGIKTTSLVNKRQQNCGEIVDPDGLQLSTELQRNGLGLVDYVQKGDASDPSQFQQQSKFDNGGRKTTEIIDPSSSPDKSDGLDITTYFQYNHKGKLIAKINPNGNTRYYIRDEYQNIRFEVDPAGGVVEYQYNLDNDKTAEIHYVTALKDMSLVAKDPSATNLENLIKEIAATNDEKYYYVYDTEGLLSFKYSASGRLTLYYNNGIGQQMWEQHFATLIDTSIIPTEKTFEYLLSLLQNLVDYDNDFVIVHAKDNANRTIYSVDPEWQVTEYFYNSNNEQIGKRIYKNPIETLDILKGEVSVTNVKALLLADDMYDREEYHVHNALNCCRFDCVSDYLVKENEGKIAVVKVFYITEYFHDDNGNLAQSIRYAEPIELNTTTGVPTEQAVSDALIQIEHQDNDRSTKYGHDTADRKVSVTDVLDGNTNDPSEKYSLNACDKITCRQDRLGNLWKAEFDCAMRKVKTIEPAITSSDVLQGEDGHLVATEIGQKTLETDHVRDNNGNEIKRSRGSNSTAPRVVEFTPNLANIITTIKQSNIPVEQYADLPTDEKAYAVKTVDLLTIRVPDAKGRIIVEQRANAALHFKVYNSDGELAYEVNHKGFIISYQYDALGNTQQICCLFNPIADFAPTKYSAAGISYDSMQSSIVPDDRDRVITFEHNRRKQKTKAQKKPSFYLRVAANGEKIAQNATPTTRWLYDNFGYVAQNQEVLVEQSDLHAEETVATPQRKNQRGGVIVELDKNGYPTWYERDADNKIILKIVFTKKLPNNIDIINADLAGIKKALADCSDNDTRTTCIIRDSFGNPLEVTLQAGFLSEFSTDKKCIIKSVKDLVEHTVYNANRKPVKIVDAKGNARFIYYNERGVKKAEVQKPRITSKADDAEVTVPITIFEHNIFSEIIKETDYANSKQNDQGEFVGIADGTELNKLKVYDVRGLNSIAQDANGALLFQSYDAMKKTARQWQWVRTPEIDAADAFSMERLLHLKQIERNMLEQDILTSTLNDYIDGKPRFFQVQQGFNVFNDHIGRKTTDTLFDKTIKGALAQQQITELEQERIDFPSQLKHNVNGDLIFSNTDDGIPTVHFPDLLGRENAHARSMADNYRLADPKTYPDLINQPCDKVQLALHALDGNGKTTDEYRPGFHEHPYEPLTTEFKIGTEHPEFGGKYSISWPKPDHQGYVAILRLRSAISNELWQELKVVEQGERWGVDISDYATGRYEYDLAYYYIT